MASATHGQPPAPALASRLLPVTCEGTFSRGLVAPRRAFQSRRHARRRRQPIPLSVPGLGAQPLRRWAAHPSVFLELTYTSQLTTTAPPSAYKRIQDVTSHWNEPAMAFPVVYCTLYGHLVHHTSPSPSGAWLPGSRASLMSVPIQAPAAKPCVSKLKHRAPPHRQLLSRPFVYLYALTPRIPS